MVEVLRCKSRCKIRWEATSAGVLFGSYLIWCFWEWCLIVRMGGASVVYRRVQHDFCAWLPINNANLLMSFSVLRLTRIRYGRVSNFKSGTCKIEPLWLARYGGACFDT